ncbi:MAG: hypothetical protein UW37_C0045G0005 [Candidatus Gottesmanbacteria bacterium GW2011_GWA2_44_17]|uniref:Uncharacterized protein n=1 Tax=Candidatus Gottesmanbacteria bacterium GW2011_GWA2_44_17 TaxID=1618444 RepID=A0A0G1KCP5_9BACT|nr:MAG: hypothetical protein UW37_C0045G0005 [Candidatus Gottesmanbacteria bacterium GW2011_GWA2_44_17]
MSVVVPREKIFIAREWLVVVIMTFIMIVAWIGVSVYQVLSKSDIAPAQAERLKVFLPTLDEAALQNLENRKTVEPTEKAQ